MIGWKQARCSSRIGLRQYKRVVTGESVWRWACWDRVKWSNHTVNGDQEGANKQQSRRKSGKDRIDSRMTGRMECDEEENDVRDKAEWHKCHHANLSCTLPLYFTASFPLLSRSEALLRWTTNGQHGSQHKPTSNQLSEPNLHHHLKWSTRVTLGRH